MKVLRIRVEDAYPHSLGSTHQEVQDPITEGGVELKVSELGGHNGVKC